MKMNVSGVNINDHCRKMKRERTKEKAHLLVEYPIPLIDIRDIALVFVEALARELAFLVDAVDIELRSEFVKVECQGG
jgi:hypothetical protein